MLFRSDTWSDDELGRRRLWHHEAVNMPNAPKRSCMVGGCTGYAEHHGRCGPHAAPLLRLRARERMQEAGRHWYFTARWKALRLAVLSQSPLCVICSTRDYRPMPATEVDHIVPHRGSAVLFWDRSNLQPICSPCHDRKSQEERGGRVARLPKVDGGGGSNL